MKRHAPSDDAQMRRLIGHLRFRHLQLLVALHEAGSLRAAASVMGQTQPALSKSLSEIEQAFGFALFTRNVRGLQPTPEGAIAIRGAVQLLGDLARLNLEARARPAITMVRVGAPPFVAQDILPDVFTHLLSTDRHLRIELVEGRVPLLVQALMDGQVDALLTSYPLAMVHEASQLLQHERFFDARFAIIAPKAHALARRRKVDWAMLAAEPWIMPPDSSMVRRLIDDGFRQAGVMPPAPVIESTSPVTNVRLVSRGLGLAVVPMATLQALQHPGNVSCLRMAPGLPSVPVALIHRGSSDGSRVAMVRKALTQALHERSMPRGGR